MKAIRIALPVLCVGWVAASAISQEAGPSPLTSRISWADSDSLNRKLEAIAKRLKGARPETIMVTEREVSSYLNLGYASRLPQGLSDLDLKFGAGSLEARAMVDLDRVRGQIPSTGTLNPVTYLSGRVPVEIRGRFVARDGFGTLEPDEVRLGGYPIPVTLLQQTVLVATRTAQNPQGVDILAPFRLPYSVKRVRLRPGSALIDL